ncbi:MAG: hypothetical protein AAF623_14095 [Planctomycetota bacterium]
MSNLSDSNLFDDDSMEDSSGLLDDLSSDDSPNDFDDSAEMQDDVGMTSEEAEPEQDVAAKKKQGMSLFDVLMIVAFVLISLATLKLIFELQTFGPFPGFVWRVNL